MRRGTGRWVFALAALLMMPFVSASRAGAQQVDWERLNPGFKGVTFVNDDKTCASSHEDTNHKFDLSAHAEYFKAGKTALKGTCESCHGAPVRMTHSTRFRTSRGSRHGRPR